MGPTLQFSSLETIGVTSLSCTLLKIFQEFTNSYICMCVYIFFQLSTQTPAHCTHILCFFTFSIKHMFRRLLRVGTQRTSSLFGSCRALPSPMYSSVGRYHRLFNQSPTDKRSGGFQSFSTTNNAAVTCITCFVSLRVYLQDKFLEVEFLGQGYEGL